MCRHAAYILALAFILCRGVASSDEKAANQPLPPEKWDVTYLERAYALKLKKPVQYTFHEGSPPGAPAYAVVTFLFEFTRNVDDVQPVLQAFEVGSPGQPSRPTCRLYFFDDENVLIMTRSLQVNPGEITGTKGDAFRAQLSLPRKYLYQARKVELRPVKSRK